MRSPKSEQNGFAILIVLIAMVIGMLLFFVQIDTLFGPDLPTETVGIEEYPWVLEELLVPDDETVKLPRSPKLELNEPFTITAGVRRNEANRGTVTIAFDTNGRVTSQWQCVYQQTEQGYQIDAHMNGNIVVKQPYQDETGKDKRLLFFIARGKYIKMPLNSAAAAGGERGAAWLTGWIDPDRGVRGHVTITTDREWAAAYAFRNSESTSKNRTQE